MSKLPEELLAIGVSSPYAWDVVESAHRASLIVTCVDNFGDAPTALPRLEILSSSTPRNRPFTMGLSSADHRGRALIACAAEGFTTPLSLVDPTAVVASTTILGHAVYVNAGAVIGSNATIGCATNVNRSASIGHDNVLGFSVSFGPGAVSGGGVTFDDCASVGTGATLLPGITVGRGAIIGAGAVVTKNVAPFDVVVGNPARSIVDLTAPRATPHPATELLTCPYCEAS